MSIMTDVKFYAPASVSMAERLKSIKAALHVGKTSVDQASFYMLSLYRTNLEVRLRSIDESTLQSDSQKKIYATLTKMLEAHDAASTTERNFEWDEIYKAESLLALLFSGALLRQEIGARLQEFAIEDPAAADALRQEYEAPIKCPAKGHRPDDAMLRVFLLRLMEALHWSAKKKYLARPIRIEATNRILVGLLFSFALLVAPYVYLIWDFTPRNAADGFPVSSAWTLFALWTALSAGLLGAFFSRLISVQRQWSKMTLDEVFLHREWPYTLLRAGVGVCGALVVYFFLRSGIAEGALFPKFSEVRIEFINVRAVEAVGMAFVMPSAALALLTFWCFLAGFSEALVPSILSSAERQITDAATSAKGRVGGGCVTPRC